MTSNHKNHGVIIQTPGPSWYSSLVLRAQYFFHRGGRYHNNLCRYHTGNMNVQQTVQKGASRPVFNPKAPQPVIFRLSFATPLDCHHRHARIKKQQSHLYRDLCTPRGEVLGCVATNTLCFSDCSLLAGRQRRWVTLCSNTFNSNLGVHLNWIQNHIAISAVLICTPNLKFG